MNPQEFHDRMVEELGRINTTLLEIYSKGSALCIKWKFGDEREFTSCFVVENEYFMTFPQEVIEYITKDILMTLTDDDVVVGKINRIKKSRKRAA
jgi:hypothetical protein